MNNKKIKILMRYTAGLEHFQSLNQNLYKKEHGIVLLYDITCRETFKFIGYILKSIKHNTMCNLVVMLVGNKCDESAERKITKEEAEKLGSAYGVKFYEISSLKKVNLKELFNDFIKHMLEKYEKNKK